MELQLQTNLLERLRSTDIVQRQSVQLSSGESSDYYIDMKKAFGDPKTLLLMAQAMYAMLPQGTTCVAGGGHGGVPLATAVSLASGLSLALVRSDAHAHGLQKEIEGYQPTAHDVVAIIEDVVTTGKSSRIVAEAVKGRGAQVVGWYSAVWRGTGEMPSELSALFFAEELLQDI